ncbi:hypothetical protein HWV62_10170 [Athelia sp. TMB]|nr:hypothetical protein HWV62_10170 [Athelia sp. TMB]
MYWIIALQGRTGSESALVGHRIEQQLYQKQIALHRNVSSKNTVRSGALGTHNPICAVGVPLLELRNERVLGWQVIWTNEEEIVSVANAMDGGGDGIEAVVNDGGVRNTFGDFAGVPGEGRAGTWLLE